MNFIVYELHWNSTAKEMDQARLCVQIQCLGQCIQTKLAFVTQLL